MRSTVIEIIIDMIFANNIYRNKISASIHDLWIFFDFFYVGQHKRKRKEKKIFH